AIRCIPATRSPARSNRASGVAPLRRPDRNLAEASAEFCTRPAARPPTRRSRRAHSDPASGSSTHRPPPRAPLRYPPIDAFLCVQLLVAALEVREAERLLAAQADDAVHRQALMEQLQHPVLQLAVEVDHHVAAQNQVELGERPV